jgi:nucleotide-binding universal stress UspA family protein
MKTILLLTDHTKPIDHAARYAVRLARRFKASVLVSDSILAPTGVLKPDGFVEENGPGVLPGGSGFETLCCELERYLLESTLPGSFVPEIYRQTAGAPDLETINDIEDRFDIAFVVLAANPYYGSHTVMIGENCGKVLKSTRSPVIAVPENAPVRLAEKYTFITDFAYDNAACLEQLSALAGVSAAELMLVNVNNGRPLDGDQENALKALMKELIYEVTYGRMYYKHIPNETPETDMEWLFKNNRFEALALAYPKSSTYKHLLRFDYAERILGNIDVPVIIYPLESER